MVELAQRRMRPATLPVRLASAPAWDGISALILLCGLGSIFLPTFWDLAYGRNSQSAQGHEFVVVAVSVWLLWRNRASLTAGPAAPHVGWALVILAMAAYTVARSQQSLRTEAFSTVVVLVGTLLCVGGWTALRSNWFALVFMLFAVPLTFEIEQLVTFPLKQFVSMAATWLLGWAGYPIGRSGVILTIGQYQLLVAKACAGLHTMFTLEAMGLLYLNLMAYKSWARNLALALLVVPISLAANVIRVILIALITYHFGDAAGQGFMHGLAGIVLFGTALALIISMDAVLGRLLPEGRTR